MNLVHCRKDAKALRRAGAAGDVRARARAGVVPGERADGRFLLSDDGRALERTGASVPWRGVAERLERELDVNISRSGAVGLPVVAVGPGEADTVERIARASLAFYQDLLDLD